MDSLPSPAASPILSHQLLARDSPQATLVVSRKRARSSSSEASSSKRAMSEDPLSSAFLTSNCSDSSQSQPASVLTFQSSASQASAVDVDIDSYMQSQDQSVESMSVVSVPSADLNLPSNSNVEAPEERYKLINDLKKMPMKEGSNWYLVARSWFRRWEKACTGEVDKEGHVLESQIGAIDNSSIAGGSEAERTASLIEGVDVEFVPEIAWIRLVEWYGEPSHTFSRKVILRGLLKEPILELHPPSLRVFKLTKEVAENSEDNSEINVSVSATATLKTLYDAFISALGLDGVENYRVWKVGDSGLIGIGYPFEKLLSEGGALMPPQGSDSHISETLDEALVQSGDSFIIEIAGGEGWIVDSSNVPGDLEIIARSSSSIPKTSPTNPGPLFKPRSGFFEASKGNTASTEGSVMNGLSESDASKSLVYPPNGPSKFSGLGKVKAEKSLTAPAGLLGLGNMGNTCFMNSALQCLAHTASLVEYFLTGVYHEELNPTNPLGMQGAIAEVFGALLRRIWFPSGFGLSFSPREFKFELQRFAPQFSGYQQHDSQELVAFLLDGLHEDLNRVIQKPYVEKPDWEGGGDKEVVELAKKSWEGYMKRNDSVIVDLFQGQYKSTLVCPECQKVSITFDPFMYLTLPLPIQKKWSHSIFYVPWDNTKPHVKIPVDIDRNASFKEVRQLLGRWMSVNPDNLLTLEVFSNRFYKDLDDTVMVSDMSSNDAIVCFELPCHAQQSRTWKPNDGTDPVILAVHLTKELAGSRTTFRSGNSGFAHPFVIVLSPQEASEKNLIYEAIVDRLQRWTSNTRDLYQWELEDAGAHIAIELSDARTNITEIKENGDIVTVLEPEEGDIVDAKGVVLEEEKPHDSSNGLVRKVGPKLDLFEMNIQTGNDKFGTGSNWSVTQRWESWDSREGRLVSRGDALYCEWDENLKTYYFGDDVKQEHCRWHAQCWDEYIHPEYKEAQAIASEKSKREITLYDCLREFTKEEQLGEDDVWYCPRCKKHQQATKKFDVWTVPDILVVHLKRFSNSRILRDKIDSFVDFPIEGLDLGTYCGERETVKRLMATGESESEVFSCEVEEPMLYDLYAVDEHIGGLGGGHYRAYAKHHENGNWYHFDDSHVSEVKASEAVNANAYLLFYKRRTSQPIGGKTFEKVQEARENSKNFIDEGQLPTPDDDKFPTPSSMSRSFHADTATVRYPTPVTNTHNSPAMSLTPPSEGNDPLDEQISFRKEERSRSNSPTSSTGVEPDVEVSESFDSGDWPDNSDDWKNEPVSGGRYTPPADYDWENSFRSESTVGPKMLHSETDESGLLDIDE